MWRLRKGEDARPGYRSRSLVISICRRDSVPAGTIEVLLNISPNTLGKCCQVAYYPAVTDQHSGQQPGS